MARRITVLEMDKDGSAAFHLEIKQAALHAMAGVLIHVFFHVRIPTIHMHEDFSTI
jgi:hypothetical protein